MENIKNITIEDVKNDDKLLEKIIKYYNTYITSQNKYRLANKEKLNETESIILKCLDKNIIYKGYLEMSKDKTIVGFRLVEENEQTFYKYNSIKKIFENNITNL